MDIGGCVHLSAFKSEWVRRRATNAEAKASKLPSVENGFLELCRACVRFADEERDEAFDEEKDDTAVEDACVCLSCARVVRRRDAARHFNEGECTSRNGAREKGVHDSHPLVFVLEQCQLYCAACEDFVYDAEFDREALASALRRKPNAAVALMEQRERQEKEVLMQKQEQKKKRRQTETKRARAAEKGEKAMVSIDSSVERVTRIECRKAIGRAAATAAIPSTFPVGLRGIVNLGNTCYMSSVLQALVSNNVVRHVFLGELHDQTTCAACMRGDPCIAREVHAVMVAAYSGRREPFVPSAMLATWWRHVEATMTRGSGGASVSGEVNRQQDAHEFFVVALDAMREHVSVPATPSLPFAGGGDFAADVVALHHPLNDIFQGSARSDVTCGVCGFTSTAFDKFTAISLDVRVPVRAKASDGSGGPSIAGALRQFTRREWLACSHGAGAGSESSASFVCPKCECAQPAEKQMSVSHLPPTLCLHLKRFEHTHRGAGGSSRGSGAGVAGAGVSRKINDHVRFPTDVLDLEPFTTAAIVRDRHGNRLRQKRRRARPYTLSACIVHMGHFDGGHYITYVRNERAWYRCDDSWVSQVDEAEVRNSQAYMLFYTQSEPML